MVAAVDIGDRPRHDDRSRIVQRADPGGEGEDLDADRPGIRPVAELDALVRHLESHAPWGARVTVERTKEAPPFRCATGGTGYAAARDALEAAYGKPVVEAGSGGSIPLLKTLQQAAPDAEFVLWGPEDVAAARIHASDESVDPSEIEAMTVAQVLLLQDLPAAHGAP